MALDMTEDQALAVKLTPSEANHLVRLVTDRRDRTLLKGDEGVSVRAMNALVAKGMAVGMESGWRLTDAGHIRSTTIY
jgi:hypothetical protein